MPSSAPKFPVVVPESLETRLVAIESAVERNARLLHHVIASSADDRKKVHARLDTIVELLADVLSKESP